jgi:enamine deaminase RidA (YjgF/YER057c/UK114 family)
MADAHRVGGWPRPSGYSDAMSATGRIVAIAGQVGWNPVTRRVETGDFAGQVRLALANVREALAAASCAPADVIRVTWYVTSREEYLANLTPVGSAWREVFGKHYPAMTLVIVAELLEPGAKVEVEVTAVAPR